MTSVLILGGARSGKSRYAQSRAEALDLKRIYIATAQAFDNEMHNRIARHRADRGFDWATIEEPIDLAARIAAHSTRETVLLVDCLTLWTSNLMLAGHDMSEAIDALTQAMGAAEGPVIFVANEVGMSIVPDNALARRFRDEAGIVNQRVAAAAEEVQLIVAGLPLKLK